MLKKIGTGLKEFILHPFLLGLFFAFFQLKQAFVLYQTSHMLLFILIAVLLAGIPFVMLYIFFKNKKKAGVIGTLTMIAFLFFDNIRYAIYQPRYVLLPYGYLKYIIALLLILLILPVLFTKSNLKQVNAYLNVLMIVLILFEFGTGCNYYLQSRKWVKYMHFPTTVAETKPPANKPDIYNIVLDAYTSSEQLKRNWGFNNAGMDTFLLSKGFYAANHAQSNSTATQMSLAMELNMNYIPNLDSIANNDAVSTSAYRLAIKNSRVTNSLKSFGYEIKNLSIFDIDDTPRFHDMHYMPDATSLPIFLFRDCLIKWPNKRSDKPFDGYTNLEVFRKLEQIPDKKRSTPIFVYAHLMMPHGPYYFDGSGNIYPDGHGMPYMDVKGDYLAQLMYTNQLLIHAIEKILSSSKTPPVIIIQGDHGSRLLREEGNHEEEYSMLARFYFPDKDYSLLNDSISPVNIYRVLFNKYFGERYPLLPYMRLKGVKDSH